MQSRSRPVILREVEVSDSAILINVVGILYAILIACGILNSCDRSCVSGALTRQAVDLRLSRICDVAQAFAGFVNDLIRMVAVS